MIRKTNVRNLKWLAYPFLSEDVERERDRVHQNFVLARVYFTLVISFFYCIFFHNRVSVRSSDCGDEYIQVTNISN